MINFSDVFCVAKNILSIKLILELELKTFPISFLPCYLCPIFNVKKVANTRKGITTFFVTLLTKSEVSDY